jgi:hypothetical protein
VIKQLSGLDTLTLSLGPRFSYEIYEVSGVEFGVRPRVGLRPESGEP